MFFLLLLIESVIFVKKAEDWEQGGIQFRQYRDKIEDGVLDKKELQVDMSVSARARARVYVCVKERWKYG